MGSISMADDTKLRPLRSTAPYPPELTSDRPDRGSAADPLAELARLIGQDNLFDQMRRDAASSGSRSRPAAAEPAPVAPARAPQPPRDELRGSYDAFAGVPAEQPAYVAMDPAPARAEHLAYHDEVPASRGYGAHHGEAQSEAYHGDAAQAYADPYYDDALPPGHEADGYGTHDPHGDGEEVQPKRRRVALAAVAAVVGVAAIGTAGAFGYRALTGGGESGQVPVIQADRSPAKVVPPAQGAGDKDGGRALYDRNDRSERGGSEKVVPREEQPVDMREARPAAPKMVVPPAGAGVPAQGSTPLTTGSTPASNPNEPKKVRTFAIRPDGTTTSDSVASRPPAAPGSRVANLGPTSSPGGVGTRPAAPSPATPESSAARPPAQAPGRTASLPTNAPNSPSVNAQPPAAGGHVVQLSSQKSEAEAQASFRSLQGKYPSVLSGRQPLIHRVDLGPRGVFYRAQVGPFASAEQANELCSSLKAAGGQCVVQRN